MTSLLPNILDFRPIALLSDFEDGMVSIQLNPQKASNLEESLKDALTFYSMLQEILGKYDAFLMPGTHSSEKTRPNIVFKVSTTGVESVNLTERLDRMGIGTNNTVTFTVSQEVRLTLVAMRGLASAIKSGIPITTIYITNMEGRLEDHLREIEAASLLRMTLEKDSDELVKIDSALRRAGVGEDVMRTGASVEQKYQDCLQQKVT